jgi:hypothetical protein
MKCYFLIVAKLAVAVKKNHERRGLNANIQFSLRLDDHELSEEIF